MKIEYLMNINTLFIKDIYETFLNILTINFEDYGLINFDINKFNGDIIIDNCPNLISDDVIYPNNIRYLKIKYIAH